MAYTVGTSVSFSLTLCSTHESSIPQTATGRDDGWKYHPLLAPSRSCHGEASMQLDHEYDGELSSRIRSVIIQCVRREIFRVQGSAWTLRSIRFDRFRPSKPEGSKEQKLHEVRDNLKHLYPRPFAVHRCVRSFSRVMHWTYRRYCVPSQGSFVWRAYVKLFTVGSNESLLNRSFHVINKHLCYQSPTFPFPCVISSPPDAPPFWSSDEWSSIFDCFAWFRSDVGLEHVTLKLRFTSITGACSAGQSPTTHHTHFLPFHLSVINLSM